MEDTADTQLQLDQPLLQQKTGDLDRYKRTFVNSAEKVLIDEDGKPIDVANNLSVMLQPGVSKATRLESALRIAKHYTPNIILNQLSKHFEYSDEQLPINPEEYHLQEKIGAGGENHVFLIESLNKNSPSFVFKINIHSYETNKIGNLLNIAVQQKKEFEEIKDTFKGVPGLVAEEYYLITHGPRKNSKVSTMVQPFIGGEIKDIFQDVEKEELRYLLETNEGFREQLKGFVHLVKENPTLVSSRLDILGKKNLAIVGEKGEESLLLLDPHFTSVSKHNSGQLDRIRNRFNYLSALLESTEPVVHA